METMKIIIKGKTPANNNLYFTTKWGRRVMTTQARKLKQEIIESTMNQATKQNYNQKEWIDRLLEVKIDVYENWYNKTKPYGIKKKDIANKEKFLMDSVMEGLRIDDKQTWKSTIIKKTEDDETKFRSEIDIEVVDEGFIINPTKSSQKDDEVKG